MRKRGTTFRENRNLASMKSITYTDEAHFTVQVGCDTFSRLCVRRVLCWLAFPLVPALGSPNSAADGSALFAGFIATMTESDFPRPCIIGYNSSPSRCGPAHDCRPDAGSPSFRHDPFVRDAVFDPGRVTMPRVTALPMLRSTIPTVSAPAIRAFRGSIAHPTQSLCTLRGRRCRRLTQHSLPGDPLRPYPDRSSTGWIAPVSLAPSGIRSNKRYDSTGFGSRAGRSHRS